MCIVNYGRHMVSDQQLRDVLENIAMETGHCVRVTSGDRNFIPKGSSSTSLHNIKEAVDFHIEGLTDEEGFTQLRLRRTEIFGPTTGLGFRFQIIRHGVHTETGGPHLHLGYVPLGRTTNSMGYLTEGLTPASKGTYRVVEDP